MSLILSRDWVCAKTNCLRAGESWRKRTSVSIILRPIDVALFTHAVWQEFTGLVVVNCRTDVAGLGNTEGPRPGSSVFKYTCKLSIVTHACVS